MDEQKEIEFLRFKLQELANKLKERGVRQILSLADPKSALDLTELDVLVSVVERIADEYVAQKNTRIAKRSIGVELTIVEQSCLSAMSMKLNRQRLEILRSIVKPPPPTLKEVVASANVTGTILI